MGWALPQLLVSHHQKRCAAEGHIDGVGVGRSAGLVLLDAVLVLRGRGVLVLGLAPRYGGVAAWDGECGEGLEVCLG